MSRPVFHIVENNPYAPQPFVLTEVAICLRDAIRAAGYPCEHVTNRIDPNAWSIVLGGSPELQRQWPQLDPKRCAIFNFEQLSSTSSLAGPVYRRWLRDWLVLDYHASNIEVLRRENGARQLALEVPLVPSASLLTPSTQGKSVDVLFYGTMSERRSAVLEELRSRGLSVEVVGGAYAWELAPALHRARLVLHIHYYESSLFPIARMLQPVMLGVPIVCETSVFSPLNDWSHSGIVLAEYEALADACEALLRSPQGIARRVQAAREFAGAIDFATPFAQVVRAFESLSHREPSNDAKTDDGNRPLADEEIEAILAREAEHLPEAGQVPPELAVVRREPGQGAYGKWIAWVLIAFMLLGAINAWR